MIPVPLLKEEHTWGDGWRIHSLCPFFHSYLKRKSSTELQEPLSPGLTRLDVHVLGSNNVGTGALSIRVSLADLSRLIKGEVVDDFVEAFCHPELAFQSIWSCSCHSFRWGYGAACFCKVVAPVSSTRCTSTRTEVGIAAICVWKISKAVVHFIAEGSPNLVAAVEVVSHWQPAITDHIAVQMLASC